ncbi:MAG: hypothetical protein QOF48_3867 [Verrucomicrobiota bacterium]|jgi:hypothetical protein
MLISSRRINLYLIALLAAGLLGAGCDTLQKKGKAEEASLRLHLEVNAAGGAQGTNVVVGRSSPFPLNIDREPFLSEFNMESAKVIDALGGFSILIQFNAEGTILLEQYTTNYRGRHAAILAEFGQVRWIAAPVMQHRITNGQFVFTPDATREEADKIVRGLNRVAELVRKGRK